MLITECTRECVRVDDFLIANYCEIVRAVVYKQHVSAFAITEFTRAVVSLSARPLSLKNANFNKRPALNCRLPEPQLLYQRVLGDGARARTTPETRYARPRG